MCTLAGDVSVNYRPANWPARSGSDPHSSKPAWPACRLKTRMGADLLLLLLLLLSTKMI